MLLIQYPPHVWAIDAVRKTVETTDISGEKLEDAVENLRDDMTVLTSRESGIARREEILKLIPKASDTLEDRRTNVHLRWYNKEMYTEKSLREKLDGALGVGNYEMSVLLDEKMIEVRVSVASTSIFNSVSKLLEDIVPLDYLISVIIFRSNIVNEYVAVVTMCNSEFEIRDSGLGVYSIA